MIQYLRGQFIKHKARRAEGHQSDHEVASLYLKAAACFREAATCSDYVACLQAAHRLKAPRISAELSSAVAFLAERSAWFQAATLAELRKDLEDAGAYYYRAGDRHSARRCLSQISRPWKATAQVCESLGLYLQAGHAHPWGSEDAVRCFTRAESWADVARAHQARQEYLEAATFYLRAGATADAALAYWQAAAFDQARELELRLGRWVRAAECSLKLGELDRAIQEFASGKAYWRAAKCCRDHGRLKEAITWYERQGCLFELAECLEAQGKLPEAIEVYRRSLDHSWLDEEGKRQGAGEFKVFGALIRCHTQLNDLPGVMEYLLSRSSQLHLIRAGQTLEDLRMWDQAGQIWARLGEYRYSRIPERWSCEPAPAPTDVWRRPVGYVVKGQVAPKHALDDDQLRELYHAFRADPKLPLTDEMVRAYATKVRSIRALARYAGLANDDSKRTGNYRLKDFIQSVAIVHCPERAVLRVDDVGTALDVGDYFLMHTLPECLFPSAVTALRSRFPQFFRNRPAP